MEEVLRFKKKDLLHYAQTYMEKLGVPADHAKIVADVMIEADIRGVDSHGIIRIYTYYGNRLEGNYMDPTTPFKVISRSVIPCNEKLHRKGKKIKHCNSNS